MGRWTVWDLGEFLRGCFPHPPPPLSGELATFSPGGGGVPNPQGPCNMVWTGNLIGLGSLYPFPSLQNRDQRRVSTSWKSHSRTRRTEVEPGLLPTPSGASKSVNQFPAPSLG